MFNYYHFNLFCKHFSSRYQIGIACICIYNTCKQVKVKPNQISIKILTNVIKSKTEILIKSWKIVSKSWPLIAPIKSFHVITLVLASFLSWESGSFPTTCQCHVCSQLEKLEDNGILVRVTIYWCFNVFEEFDYCPLFISRQMYLVPMYLGDLKVSMWSWI